MAQKDHPRNEMTATLHDLKPHLEAKKQAQIDHEKWMKAYQLPEHVKALLRAAFERREK